MVKWKYNDGGRVQAGYKGEAGDCLTRALAIAGDLSYQEAYDLINESPKCERQTIMDRLGFKWTPTMFVGQGGKVHLKASELPKGKIICMVVSSVSKVQFPLAIPNVSKYFVAVVDGVIQDTFDCSRNETRCVYGYWRLEE